MKKLVLLSLYMSGAALAQPFVGPQPTMNMPNYTTYDRAVESYAGQSGHETPTLRREKLERAIALRREAADLLREDGGTLTARHQAYVQRKARAILSYQR